MITTLQQAIESTKCRTGKAAGTTRHGAYWLACEPIVIRRAGGDGIGNNGSDIGFFLLLRHYRTGKVQATIHRDSWHQNGSYDSYESLPDDFLSASTVEDVIVRLKQYRFGENDRSEAVYGDYYEDKLTESLIKLGLAINEPAPDEAS